MRIFISLIVFIFATSCIHMAKGPQFTDVPNSPEDSILYVYRPSLRKNSSSTPSVTVNGERRFDLTNAGYRQFSLKPGKYQVVVRPSDDAPAAKAEFTAIAGKKYYLKYDIDGNQNPYADGLGVAFGTAMGAAVSAQTPAVNSNEISHLYFVNPDTAAVEIKETRLVDFTNAM